MPAQPAIGTMIRRARQRLRMSQGELAQKLGVSRSAINAWERDRAWPRNIVALEEALGITIDAAAPGPLADLYPPQDEWEATVLADSDLPDDWKRDLITASRDARARYAARRAARHAAQAREAAS